MLIVPFPIQQNGDVLFACFTIRINHPNCFIICKLQKSPASMRGTRCTENLNLHEFTPRPISVATLRFRTGQSVKLRCCHYINVAYGYSHNVGITAVPLAGAISRCSSGAPLILVPPPASCGEGRHMCASRLNYHTPAPQHRSDRQPVSHTDAVFSGHCHSL